MRLNDKEIQLIQDYLICRPVVRAYLFGSYSRNEATASSDVDILVELDYTKHIGLSFVQIKFDLEDLLQKKVDLVPADAVGSHLQANIDCDKKLIFPLRS